MWTPSPHTSPGLRHQHAFLRQAFFPELSLDKCKFISKLPSVAQITVFRQGSDLCAKTGLRRASLPVKNDWQHIFALFVLWFMDSKDRHIKLVFAVVYW